MRKLLLVIEEQPRDIDIYKVVADPRLEKFNKNDLGYALEKLIEGPILNGKVEKTKTSIFFIIDSISNEGHQFLDNIRNETIWNKIKEIASQSSVSTIKGLLPISTGVATAWLKDRLNL